MELLIGAGKNWDKKVTFDGIPSGWTELITLDIDEETGCSVVHDLESLPMPFDDDMFNEIHAYEILEHTGMQGDWRFFFNQFYEFWRILKPGGYFCATCPKWDSKWAWGDPGHKRIISPESLVFLSQKEYEVQIGTTSMTDYRPYWEGDFNLIAMTEMDEQVGFVIQAVK